MSDLESISPHEAGERFLDAMRDEHVVSTRTSERHWIRAVVQFCDEHGLESEADRRI